MILFATIFTPQGDGNKVECDAADAFKQMYLPRYLPRKGTETSIAGVTRNNHFFHICHDIYPARGRKRRQPHLLSYDQLLFATIFTPQGDGNLINTN